MPNEKKRGTSGNRKGYKVFCFNTTLREPGRNRQFLHLFEPYSGKELTKELKYQYFVSLVSKRAYTPTRIRPDIQEKINSDIELSRTDAEILIADNPQATGTSGRVMTILRALRDQGFVQFEGPRGKESVTITRLGRDLLDDNVDSTIVYTKAMIGLHANNPVRTEHFNKSRPFLNTIFAIDEVNRRWTKMGNKPIGLLKHEFGTFVLSMKDCDYKRAADEIIKYRNKFHYSINHRYIEKYLADEDILPMKLDSVIKDYPDEVYRKFCMTGLVQMQKKFSFEFINFSEYNREKVNFILKQYADYKFEHFRNSSAYYAYLYNIDIPWEKDETVRRLVVEQKEKIYGIEINPDRPLDEREWIVDKVYSEGAVDKAVGQYPLKTLYKELLILSGRIHEKSKFDDITESTRLEFVLALVLGKKYGTRGLVSNIRYNDDGIPISHAPGGKPDIEFIRPDAAFIIEPTMARNREQMLNTETTSISRHVAQETASNKIPFLAMMVAPIVHVDVAKYFRYERNDSGAMIIPISIERFIGLIEASPTVKDLAANFNKIASELVLSDLNEYIAAVNEYDALRVYEQMS